jgi:hypothetical protein
MRRRLATLLAVLATGAAALLVLGVAALGVSAATGHGSGSRPVALPETTASGPISGNGVTTEPTI